MKMKKNLSLVVLIFVLLGMSLSACKLSIEEPEDLQGKSFQTYFENREKFRIGLPDLKNRILTVKNIIDPCPPEPEGPCGFDLYITADENWEEKGEELQEFYLEDQSATERIFYGPFEDNLMRIVEEAGEMSQ